MSEIRRCTRCIMDDSSDPTITFDENGICNYCTQSLIERSKVYFPGTTELGAGNDRLDELINKVKENGKGKKYDCIMGLSGGLDSSYLTYLGYKWGLRVLLVHIDDGYDTDISKSNIDKLVKATGFDYEVIAPDAEQFNALTLAYMKAGVPNITVPQDNVLFAFLYKKMKQYKINYFLSGGNYALESILQQGNTHSASDLVNIKAIHKAYGTKPIDKLLFTSTYKKRFDSMFLKIKSPRPLNLIDYNRQRAFNELKEFCGFEYYGRKHLENILTAFAQLYWLPKKFGADKRTSHLSSMVISGQMTRDEALKEYSEPIYDEKMMNDYIAFIKKSIGISDSEFDEIMKAPTHQHTEFKNDETTVMYKLLKKIWDARK